MADLFWLGVAFVGIVLFFSGLYALLFRNRILASDLAKQGGGIRSWITKRGVNSGGTYPVRSGMYIRGIDEDGIPVAGETRTLGLPD